MTPTDPITELTASIKRQRLLAGQARIDIAAATPTLVTAIRHGSGQSRKIEALLWSLWNDDHPVNLCDTLSGLDTRIAVAVIAMIAARIHLGGDADDILKTIIDESGSQPPTQPPPSP